MQDIKRLTMYLPREPHQYIVGEQDVLRIVAEDSPGTIIYNDGHSETWLGLQMHYERA